MCIYLGDINIDASQMLDYKVNDKVDNTTQGTSYSPMQGQYQAILVCLKQLKIISRLFISMTV